MSLLMDLDLFLGCHVDEKLSFQLLCCNPYLRALLTGGGEYLQQISHNDKVYLGKFAASIPSLSHLDNLQANILSLLKRLAPSYPFEAHPPRLLAIPHDSDGK